MDVLHFGYYGGVKGYYVEKFLVLPFKLSLTANIKILAVNLRY